MNGPLSASLNWAVPAKPFSCSAHIRRLLASVAEKDSVAHRGGRMLGAIALVPQARSRPTAFLSRTLLNWAFVALATILLMAAWVGADIGAGCPGRSVSVC